MPFDFERALGETEDFLQRQIGSRAAREAQRRKVKRGISEVLRRIRRATLLFVLLLGLLIGYSLFVSPIGLLTWLLILPMLFLASLLALFWPSRRRRAEPARAAKATARPRLDLLARDTEEWILERCRALPRPALSPVDNILDRLRDLQPDLAALPAESPLAGEADRLVGGHLPRLIDSFLELPPAARDPKGENSRRLAESLGVVAEELDRLGGEIGRERRLGFATQHRFIETRYGRSED
jgi:hypothetical protein